MLDTLEIRGSGRVLLTGAVLAMLPQVLLSSPCSGHGFKFASAIGELQAQLLVDGKSTFDVAPFRIDRAPVTNGQFMEFIADRGDNARPLKLTSES